MCRSAGEGRIRDDPYGPRGLDTKEMSAFDSETTDGYYAGTSQAPVERSPCGWHSLKSFRLDWGSFGRQSVEATILAAVVVPHVNAISVEL